VALGITVEGDKERRGLWLRETAGATGWWSGVTALNNRGVEDGFIACVAGLQGLPEALAAVFPRPQGQRCLVHTVRHSRTDVPWQERQAVAADRRALYGAATVAAAEQAVERGAERWDPKDPTSSPSGLADGERLRVFFDSPPAIRRVLETTNALESLPYTLRKRLKTRGVFPNDESLVKAWYGALQPVAKKWTRPIRDWKAALNQLVIVCGERVPV
jgi:putative transposase